MKTKITFLSLLLLKSINISCTPTAIDPEGEAQKYPTIYGTGGEQSAEPDNDKDSVLYEY